MYDSNLISKKYLLTELTCQEKKSVIDVQDAQHNLKQKRFITSSNISVSKQQDQEKLRRYWQGTLQCLAHSSIKGSNEHCSQPKGCIYNTWQVVGEKEYQMKEWFHVCNIPKWENMELYNNEKQKCLTRLQK